MSDSDQGLYERLFDRLVNDETVSERCRELITANRHLGTRSRPRCRTCT